MAPKSPPSAPDAARKSRKTVVAERVAVEMEVDAQNRLIEAQASLDRDYIRLRELETRFQYLLQSSTDGVMMVSAADRRVYEVNDAACQRLQQRREQLIGTSIVTLFGADGGMRLAARLDALLAGSGAEAVLLPLADGSRATVTLALFRQDGEPVFLLRLDSSQRLRNAARETPVASPLADYALAATDAIVLTDRTGLIVETNAAFLELIQVATEKQVHGVSLGRWLGRTSVDLGVLITNLRQRGSIKLFATHLRTEFGSSSDVEISAVSVGAGADACLGFTIRDVGRRLMMATGPRNDIAKSVDQMTELVGRVPMKDIVNNTAGLIEQMCIKAALELTRGNRAAAADLLGISRQSLYVKLRRYELLDGDADTDAGSE